MAFTKKDATKPTPESFIKEPEQAAQAHEDLKTGKTVLPPKGPKRDAWLAKNKDMLAEAMAEIEGRETIHRLDPSAHKPEPEVLKYYKVDPFTGVTNVDIPGMNEEKYKYKMVQCMVPSSAPHKQIHKARAFGWRVAKRGEQHLPEGGTPLGEGCSSNAVYSGVQIGDAMLMFMPIEQFRELSALEAANNHRRETGAIAGAIHDGPGVMAHSELDDKKGIVSKLLQQGGPVQMASVPTTAQQFLRHELAKQQAGEQFTEQLKAGEVGSHLRK